MKSVHKMLVALALAAGAAHATTEGSVSRVQIGWAPDADLSEVKDNPQSRGWMRPQEWQKSLADHLRKQAERALPAGQQLQVTIDDVKLAGAFEPWASPQAQDIRVLKDVYPPRMQLHYRLSSADGSVLKEGSAKLQDLGYLQRGVIGASDPLRYDKRLLDDWLRKEFGGNR